MRLLAVAVSGGFFAGSLWGVGISRVWDNAHEKKSPGKDTSQMKAEEKILKYGAPTGAPEISYYDSHLLSYDQEKRIPRWVAENLTKQHLSGNANRKYAKFKSDPAVRDIFRSENSDYYRSGWSRGHMAPAGDFKSDQNAMNETFLLSNILPQDIANNGGFWNRFEMYCRDLTKSYEHVRVISGPVMIPSKEDDGKTYVKYEVIGENQVAVPTHIYKVIVAENSSSSPVLGAFIVPNIPIDFSHKLLEFQVPLVELEKKTGLSFLHKLDRNSKTIRDLCNIDGCKLIERNKYELYFIGRKMANANTLARLEKTWAEVESKKLVPDDYLKNLYANRKKELSGEVDNLKEG